jgi:hypothetical protein
MRSDCRRAKFSRRYSAFCRSRMIYLDGRPGAPRRSRLERLSTSVSDPSKAVAYERSRGRAGSRLIISATTISAPRTRRLTGCAAHQRRHECGSHELYPQLSSAALGVWEWTSDWYSTKHQTEAPKACCVPANPRGAAEAEGYDPCQPNIRIPRKVLKGGSHLCAPNYCRRDRPAPRHPEPIDTSTSHVGFRCVLRTQKR